MAIETTEWNTKDTLGKTLEGLEGIQVTGKQRSGGRQARPQYGAFASFDPWRAPHHSGVGR